MEHSIAYRAEALATLLQQRVGVRAGHGFEAKLAKAGRRLPRWARKEAAVVVQAMSLETHPKLFMQIDHDRVDRAFNNLARHLGAVDPWARRRAKILDAITAIAFVVFVVIALVLGVMMWRGLV